MTFSFAWMEILKAMATLFRLFRLTRMASESTVIREGFFNKAVECAVRVERR
jgi:benzoate 4-monooxygenase